MKVFKVMAEQEGNGKSIMKENTRCTGAAEKCGRVAPKIHTSAYTIVTMNDM